MFIDATCLLLLLFAAWKGWTAGFFSSLISFTGMFIGFFIAMKCSTAVAVFLQSKEITDGRWAALLAFLLVLVGVWLLLKLLAKLLSGLAEAVMMGWLNKTGGMILQLGLYTILISGFLLLSERLSIISKEAIAESRIYPVVQPVATELMKKAGEWIPWLQETLSKENHSVI